MKLSGNTIFITGGGSGIGRGLAEAFHKQDNQVIISGRRRGHLDQVLAANPGMAAIELDIVNPASINRAAAQLTRDHPSLNVLFNNAGIMLPDEAAGRIDDKLLVDTVTTNVMGPIRMSLIKSFGFQPTDLSGLVTGGRLQQAGGPLAGVTSSISATTESMEESPMRGAMIKAFGEPSEVLELVDAPEPTGPAAGEVLVGVEYTPVNINDLYVIQGAFPVRPSLPSFVGNEGVGRVLAVGTGVEHLEVGDRILIPLYAFSWRERLVVQAAGLFSLPDADPQQLAMLGINPPTASLLLDEAYDLKPGDWIVQNAANSGVGRSLIAIAKARGLKTINLVRRPELVPELQAIGGDLVVVGEDVTPEKIQTAVGNGRVQLAIDGVAGKSSALIASMLSGHGTFVVYAYMAGGPVMINPFDLIVKRVIVKGFFMNHPDIEPKIQAALRESVPLVASGAIQAPIAATYPLSSLVEAVLHAKRGGKVLLDLRAKS